MAKTREEVAAYQAAYRKKHKRYLSEYMKEYHKDYYKNNRDRLLAQQKEHVQKNKEHYRLYRRNRRLGRRMIIDRYKVFCGCMRCGYKGSAVALDLHHKDPDEKVQRVSRMVSMKMEKLRAEIRKCVVVCSNCHRELHDEQWNLEDALRGV